MNEIFIDNDCKVCSAYGDWINKKNIWGVKQNEIIKINFFQKLEDLFWKSFNFLNRI